jgi:YtcA family
VKREQLKSTTPLIPVALLLSGCSGSPAQNVLGSFFPAWMLCAALGIVVAVIIRQILSALGINEHLIAPPLTYLCFAVAGTLLIWLVWFGH